MKSRVSPLGILPSSRHFRRLLLIRVLCLIRGSILRSRCRSARDAHLARLGDGLLDAREWFGQVHAVQIGQHLADRFGITGVTFVAEQSAPAVNSGPDAKRAAGGPAALPIPSFCSEAQ